MNGFIRFATLTGSLTLSFGIVHVRSVIKIDEHGGLDCVKILENHGVGGRGVAWDAFGMSLASFDHDFSANWRLDGRRMG